MDYFASGLQHDTPAHKISPTGLNQGSIHIPLDGEPAHWQIASIIPMALADDLPQEPVPSGRCELCGRRQKALVRPAAAAMRLPEASDHYLTTCNFDSSLNSACHTDCFPVAIECAPVDCNTTCDCKQEPICQCESHSPFASSTAMQASGGFGSGGLSAGGFSPALGLGIGLLPLALSTNSNGGSSYTPGQIGGTPGGVGGPSPGGGGSQVVPEPETLSLILIAIASFFALARHSRQRNELAPL